MEEKIFFLKELECFFCFMVSFDNIVDFRNDEFFMVNGERVLNIIGEFSCCFGFGLVFSIVDKGFF